MSGTEEDAGATMQYNTMFSAQAGFQANNNSEVPGFVGCLVSAAHGKSWLRCAQDSFERLLLLVSFHAV